MRKNLLFATLIIIFGFIGCTKAPISPEVASVPTVQSPNQTALDGHNPNANPFLGKWKGFYFQVRSPINYNDYPAEVQIISGYIVYSQKFGDVRYTVPYELSGNNLIFYFPKSKVKNIILTYDAKDGKLHGHRGDESGNIEGWRWIFERIQ